MDSHAEMLYRELWPYHHIKMLAIPDLLLCNSVGANFRKLVLYFGDNIMQTSFFFFVRLVGFLKSSSTTRLYSGRAPRQSV